MTSIAVGWNARTDDVLFLSRDGARMGTDVPEKFKQRMKEAGNAARFLSYFDKRQTPHFAQLRESVAALVTLKTIASSVEVGQITVEGGDGSDVIGGEAVVNGNILAQVQVEAGSVPAASLRTRSRRLAGTFW